jgi:hypothetical protein
VEARGSAVLRSNAVHPETKGSTLSFCTNQPSKRNR